MTMEESTMIFDWFKETTQHTQAVEYAYNNSKYKIYQNTLESVEVKDIIPHCLQVKQKMKSVTSTQTHLDARYFDVMGRTLGMAIRAVFDRLVTDNSYPETEAGVNQAIRDLVEVHAVDEDRYDTVQHLRNAHKPRKMKVMTFYYRPLEINGYVEWLPGTEAKLNDDAIKSAFFEAMPFKWKGCFSKAGHSRVNFTMAQTVRFFRTQESAAIKKQIENETFQKRNKKTFKRNSNSDKSSDKMPHRVSKTRTKCTDSKSKATRISDDACPIHPESDHNWGDCKSNHYSEKGKDLRKKAYENRKNRENNNESNKGDNHMAQSLTETSISEVTTPTLDERINIRRIKPYRRPLE